MTTAPQSCPSRELLIEAAAPDARAEAREALADHLIACVSCADEFRLLRAVAPWAAEHAHLLPPAGEVRAAPGVTGVTLGRWLYAAAAVFIVATAWLAFEVTRLTRVNHLLEARLASPAAAAAAQDPAARHAAPVDLEARLVEQQRAIAALEQRLRAAEMPDVNTPIVDLEPADALRSASRGERVTIPADARTVVFVLNATHVRPGALFDVDVVATDGRVTWSGSGLKQSAAGTLTLQLPRAIVDGSTRVRLYSRGVDRRTLVEEYALPARR